MSVDPTLIISGFSATLQAIQTWLQFRDSRRALGMFRDRFESGPQLASIRNQARYLSTIIPQPVLDTLGDRVRRCWDKYQDVLGGDFLPGEIDEATVQVKRCLCRELKRIAELNGGRIPPGDLTDWWVTYCS